jgi:hypothetical protein
MLLVEGDGLPFDSGEYLFVLREMRASINVVRILDEMRGDLAALFKVNLGFARPIRGN